MISKFFNFLFVILLIVSCNQNGSKKEYDDQVFTGFPRNKNGQILKISNVHVLLERKDMTTGVIDTFGVIKDYTRDTVTRYSVYPMESHHNLKYEESEILPKRYFYFDKNQIFTCIYFESTDIYIKKNKILNFNESNKDEKFKKMRLFFQEEQKEMAASWISPDYTLGERGSEFTNGISSNVSISNINSGDIKIKSIDKDAMNGYEVETFSDILILSQLNDQDKMIINKGCY